MKRNNNKNNLKMRGGDKKDKAKRNMTKSGEREGQLTGPPSNPLVAKSLVQILARVKTKVWRCSILLKPHVGPNDQGGIL